MRTNVYVDGFNLYYCCLKNSPHRWLDISALMRLGFPRNRINRIRYFTAKVRATPNDPQKPQRQNTYLRALRTIPNLSIHLGRFARHIVLKPLAAPLPGGPRLVEVVDTKEKGSDVNLATYLLTDAFEGDYEVGIIVSNDADLAEPIRVVQEKLPVTVGILCPQRDRRKTAWRLKQVGTFYRRIRTGLLKASQFPETLTDANGPFSKPSAW